MQKPLLRRQDRPKTAADVRTMKLLAFAQGAFGKNRMRADNGRRAKQPRLAGQSPTLSSGKARSDRTPLKNAPFADEAPPKNR
jgi:hypothetical protein